MKISSVQIGWALAIVVVLGFFIPWVRYAPNKVFDNSLGIAEQLANDRAEWLYDYVLINHRDWRDLWQDPAAGASGYQIVMTDQGEKGSDAARTFIRILFGEQYYWVKAKVLLLAPWLAIFGALALAYRKKAGRWLLTVLVAEVLFYLYVRWQLHSAYVDRLVLEMNWGIWVTLYGLLLLAILQTVRLLLPPKVKW